MDWDIVLAGAAKVVKGVKTKPSLSAIVTGPTPRNLRRVATSVRPTWATEQDPSLTDAIPGSTGFICTKL